MANGARSRSKFDHRDVGHNASRQNAKPILGGEALRGVGLKAQSIQGGCDLCDSSLFPVSLSALR